MGGIAEGDKAQVPQSEEEAPMVWRGERRNGYRPERSLSDREAKLLRDLEEDPGALDELERLLYLRRLEREAKERREREGPPTTRYSGQKALAMMPREGVAEFAPPSAPREGSLAGHPLTNGGPPGSY